MSLLTQKQIEEIQTFQSEQEPTNNIGYLYKQKDCYGAVETVFSFDNPYITWHNVTDVIPVYIAPPKREPLSKEEYMSLFIDTYHSKNPITDFVRLIEKAHGIGVTK